MTFEQKDYLILFTMFAAAVIIIASFWMYISEPIKHPIESTITKRDDCTVIKTMLTDTDYIFVSVCKIIEM